MPASPTRLCPTCNTERLIAEFRDLDDVTVGRPPKFCRYCRAESPKLQTRQAVNRARRAAAAQRQRRLAARHPLVRMTSTISTHRDGIKRCPPLSGCGQELPLWAFNFDIYQADGLSSRCRSCISGSQKAAPIVIPARVPDRMPVPLRQFAEMARIFAAS